jgi:hypothetical protein
VDADTGFPHHRGIDVVEELQELLVPVPPVALADDLPGGDVQGGEQGRGSVADVVVGAPLGLGRGHRQDRLGAVESLDLTLLVDRQDDGSLWRGQVQPDDIPDLLHEVRVGGQLERVGAVGFNLNARQIRLTADWDIPAASAIPRVLQWVALAGLVSRVLVTTRSTAASVTVRGAPGRGSSTRPSSRLATNRFLQVPTVAAHTFSRAATVVLFGSSAQARTMPARRASRWVLLG